MYRYRFTRLAQRDLDAIFAHIAVDNPPAAGRVVGHFRERARRVTETPLIGASRRDLRPPRLHGDRGRGGEGDRRAA
jgi:plasmid stabilization system protein ParE